jgi:multiple sugar transport system permease protein
MKIRILRILSYLVILGAVLVYGIPISWIIVSSFKPVYNALLGYGVGQILFFFQPTLSAYQRVLSTPFVADLEHSLIVAIGTVAICIVLGLPAAFQLARVKNAFTRNLAAWIISTRMAPAFALSLSFFVLMSQIIHLYDTVFALMIAYLTFNLSLSIWILMGYIQEIPVGIERAATIDGASRLQMLRRIIIPLSKPAIITVSIIVFLFSWNEFLFAFLLTSESARTVPVFIANYVGIVVIDWPAMTAISTMFMIPSLILLILAQKYIVKGLTMGALK